jgi:hypothetical protein
MTKKQRLEVYNKFNGHCAYCGKEIEYKDMQVDHQIPQRRAKRGRNKVSIEVVEDPNNWFPSCRRCNLHKRASNLETYRRYVEEIPQKLLATFIYKAGLDYKLIEVKPRKIKFYFEMTDEEREEYNKINTPEPAIEVYPIEESDIIEAGEFF